MSKEQSGWSNTYTKMRCDIVRSQYSTRLERSAMNAVKCKDRDMICMFYKGEGVSCIKNQEVNNEE